MDFSESSPAHTPNITISLEVNNTGNVSIPDVNVKIYNGETLLEDKNISVDNNSFSYVNTTLIADSAGTYNITAVVDADDVIVEWNETNNNQAKNITIENNAPVLGFIDNMTVNESDLVIITANATDADNDTLTYSINDTGFEQNGSVFTWQTGYTDAGVYVFEVTASDGFSAETDSQNITVTVNNINSAPVLDVIDNITVYEGDTVSIDPSASDAENDTLNYSYSGWMSSDSYATDYDDAGTHTVTVSVSDGEFEDSQNMTVTVLNAYEFRTAAADIMTHDFVSAKITLDGTTKQTSGDPPKVVFDYVKPNTKYDVKYKSSGYKTALYPIYFDERLGDCSQGSDCSLGGSYSTSCDWSPKYSDWLCSVSHSSFSHNAIFTYDPSQNAIKRVNYLEK